jgi:hypothetical protein
MMQRVAEHLQALSGGERAEVLEWLTSWQQQDIAELELGPKLQRDGLTTRLA